MRSGEAPVFLWGIAAGAVGLLVWLQVATGPKEPTQSLHDEEAETQPMPTPPPPIPLNAPAPSFGDVSLLTGEQVSVGSLRGKVVILDFWATWCGPCRMVFPVLNDIHKKYGKSDVAILGITHESTDLVRPFVKKAKLNYGIVADTSQLPVWMDTYRTDTLPTLAVIDRNGKLRFYEHGVSRKPGDTTEDRLNKLIPQLVAEK